jgi:hypothetical protein
LIATVDKFAQMTWQGPVQALFGQVIGWCPRCGFRSPKLEDTNSHLFGQLPIASIDFFRRCYVNSSYDRVMCVRQRAGERSGFR